MWIILVITAVLVVAHIALTWRAAIVSGQVARNRTDETSTAPPSTADMPKVSVLIPAWKEYGTLEHCIHSLDKVTYPNWECIIVAGGPDDTFTYAQGLAADRPHFKAVEQPPKGKNAALNLGFGQANGEIIVVLDADSRVEPDWLTHLISPFAHGAEATTGNFHPERQTPVSMVGEMEKIIGYEVYGGATLQGSGSIALKREIIDAMGGFHEGIVVGVDWDLNLRVEQGGYQRAFAPGATVYTERPATVGEFWKNEVRWRRAHLWLLYGHRAWFTRSIPAMLGAALFYVVTLAATGGLLLTLLAALVGAGEVALFFAGMTALFLLWSTLRRAALAGQVAAYKDDQSWLRYGSTVALLLLLAMLATWRAVLTLHKKTPHFKGPRVLTESRAQ